MSDSTQTGAAPVEGAAPAPRTKAAKAAAAAAAAALALPVGPTTFDEMGLSPEVRRALEEMGFSAPMPVQSAVFQMMHDGKDVMVQSRTGSGKTAAFGIPLVEKLGAEPGSCVEALILAPTRELALQSASECSKIAKYRKLDVVPVYGGAPMGKQIEQLKAGAQIVSGTPGRVLDHLRRGTLKLDGLKVLVLDEADEMLSMGFLEEITEIIKKCPTDRQTVLFSATIPEDIERIGSRYMRSPEKIQLSSGNISVHTITHAYYSVSGMSRTRDLLKILQAERPESAVIFCNTRDDTNVVAEYLRKQGIDAEAISSDLTQKDRERVMTRMKEKNLKYLVATDIAARGIDISDLSHVINYTFPESAEVYVHRTGRTGRAGKSGVAISIISPRELGNFYMLKLTYRIRPEERPLPSDEQLKTHKEGSQLDEIRKALEGKAPSDELRALAKRLVTADGGTDLVALLMEAFLANAPATARVMQAPTPIPSPVLEARPERQERGGRSERGPRSDRASRPEREPRGEREPRAAKPAEGLRAETPVAAPAGAEGEAPARRRRRRGEPRDGAPKVEGGAKVEGTIDTSSGREFWEAWVDSKSDAPAATDAGPASAAPKPRRVEADTEDREPRRGRRERGPRAIPIVPEGQARLYLNLGKRDGAEEPAIREILLAHQVDPLVLDVMSSHSYLNVNEGEADGVITRLASARFGERELRCERARP